MRRQRLLRAPSAQNLCIFCACRLGVQVPPSQVAPLRSPAPRRNLNTGTAPLRQGATAVASSNDHGPSNGDAPGFSFDPNSSLTFAEQQEKAYRINAQREREAREQQLKQGQIWHETEVRQRASNRKGWGNGRDNARGDQRRDGRNAPSSGTPFGAKAPGVEGQSLGQAMSGSRSLASNDRSNRNGDTPVIPRKFMVGKARDDHSDVSNERQHMPQHQEPQSSSKNNNRPRKKAMPSFLSSTGSVAWQAAAASGWGAGGSKTLPVEYGTASERNPAIRDVSEREIVDRREAQRVETNEQQRPAETQMRPGINQMRIRPRFQAAEPVAQDLDSGPREFYPDRDTRFESKSGFDVLADWEATQSEPEQSIHRASQASSPLDEILAPATNMGSFGFYEDAQTETAQLRDEARPQGRGLESEPTAQVPRSQQSSYQAEPIQAATPLSSITSAKKTAPADDFEFIGFGLQDVEPEETSTPVSRPSKPTQQVHQAFQPPPQGVQYQPPIHSGYRTEPFDPNEFESEFVSADVDHSANWQHLRRKTTEPPPPPPTEQAPPPTPPPAQVSSSFFDDDWVDRKFEEHRQSRPQVAPPPPPQQTDERDYRPLSDPAKARSRLKCGRCGEIGHTARDCTGQNRAQCHACGGVGHFAQDCPNKHGRRQQSVLRKLIDDPYEDERSPRPYQRTQRPRKPAQDFDDPFSRPNVDQVVQPTRRQERRGSDMPANQRRQRDMPDDSRRANPFAESGSEPIWRMDRSQRQGDDQYRNARATGVQKEAEPYAAPAPYEVDAEESSRRQDARALRRRQKWADADDRVESERFSRNGRDRKERRGGRRDFDEDHDEETGAREEYRARKAARQAEDNAARQAKNKVKRQTREAWKAAQTTPITLPEWTSVQQLSQLLGVRYEQFVERLEDLGYDDIFPGKTLNSEISGMIAMEYNFEPTFDFEGREEDERDLKPQPEPEDKELLPARPPVVTIMGHVDHGKTTILDYLRKSSVAAGEAGGITQHIGAFSVPLASSGKTITFLDTPGHAAFLAMRQRGANVTDIVILVVAADDSVKPQTLEALKHAKAAGVPMIVAINKVDKEEADIQRCKQDLARHGVEIEDFGGETQVVCVSGKTGKGMDELEENVVTLSEILDHRADTNGLVEGWVLEATTKKAGRVATVLVRRGTLKPGCVLVAGKTWARVRTLRNEAGNAVLEVGPGMPVEVDGWRDQPMAGDEVLQAETEQQATSVVEFREEKDEREKIAQDTEAINETRRLDQERREKERAAEAAAKRVASGALEDEAISAGTDRANAEEEQSGQMIVPFIIKADVSGSVEAVSAYILSVSNPLIAPKILSSGVGAIHESDIDLASAASAHIIAFNLPPDPDMKALAEHRGVRILENNIIYRVLDDVKTVMEDKLPPIIKQRVLGEAEVAMQFEIGLGGRKKLKIAGCKVRNGVVNKGARVRVTRNGEKVYEGTITSLKNVKKDVQEMRKGTECGMGFDGWEGFESGDQVQTFAEIEEKRRL